MFITDRNSGFAAHTIELERTKYEPNPPTTSGIRCDIASGLTGKILKQPRLVVSFLTKSATVGDCDGRNEKSFKGWKKFP